MTPTPGKYYTATTTDRDKSWAGKILLVLAVNDAHACVKLIDYHLNRPVLMQTDKYEWHDAQELFDAYASVVPVLEVKS
jgi:hypothetical protein